MAVYTASQTSALASNQESKPSWASVLTASTAKTFRFDILAASADGSQIRIRNIDGTTTMLDGQGLACTARRGDAETWLASLTAGTITAMRRLAEDGTELEAATDLSVLAGGPSKVHSFSRPPGTMSSLAWVLDLVDGAEAAVAAASPAGKVASQQPITIVPPSTADTLDISSIETPAANSGGSGVFASRTPMLVFGAALAVGFVAVLLAWRAGDSSGLEREKAQFARPTSIPAPADNQMSPARIGLGRRLFNETRLSVNGKVACTTCHDPERAFSQEVAFGKGVTGKPLRRHTQSLWNAAWGRAFFWDGRAPTLEAQVKGPLEDPDEMGQNMEISSEKLRADPSYVSAFAAAFPGEATITPDLIMKSLAAYERSLVSPPTRFDRWIAGDPRALSTTEVEGFRVFTGKAGCVTCHSGWAFTDHGFHDIGLPGTDRGRGGVMGLANLDHAFKTPSLRELKWTGPYMHDGSRATLDDVLRHYESGIVFRPSLSPDVPRKLELTATERDALLAFLGSLSSDGTPKARTDIEVASGRSAVAPAAVSQLSMVGQKEKRFAPEHVRIKVGETLVVVNNDTRPHNVSIAHPRLGYSSGLQEPGDLVKLPFPEVGNYEIFCGIHPTMRLQVDVEPRGAAAK